MSPERHAKAVSPAIKQQLRRRLQRIAGQIQGIERMIEAERYCPDILMQVSAVQESLRAAGKLLLRNHLQHCATQALGSGDEDRARETYDELTRLFYLHAR